MRNPAVALCLTVVLAVSSGVGIAQDTQAQNGQPKPTDAAAAKSDGPSKKAQIPATLMFTIDELNDIQGRMASGQQEGEDGMAEGRGASNKIEDASLYLSTIVYYGPEDWTIWVNGKPIGPSQDFTDFKVTDIGPRYVELLVPLSAQGMRPVRLEPNQTFISKSGAVVEGAWKK